MMRDWEWAKAGGEDVGAGTQPAAPWTDAPSASGAMADAPLHIEPDELAAAIARAMRELEPAPALDEGEDGDEGGLARGRLGWLIVAGAGGAFLAGLAGIVIGIALAGYLAAPNRAVALVSGAIAAVGFVRTAGLVRAAMRVRSWRVWASAALDGALSLCAAALAVGMRP